MPPTIINTPQIYVSDTLVGPDEPQWTQSHFLRVVNLTTGQSPTIDQATLLWHFGEMRRESDGEQDAAMAYVAPLELTGKFVHIVEETKGVDWYGYVLAAEMDRGPEDAVNARIAWGNQTFAVVGLEWFLSRVTIHSSTVYDPDDGTIVVQRAIGFNAGFGEGRGVTYERRENRDSAATIFADDPTTAVLWSATDAVQYLLDSNGPKTAGGAPSPTEFTLETDSEVFLNDFHPTVFTEGRSLWQVLNDIISHNRGLSWRLVPDYGIFFNEFHVMLRVTSMATAAIALPGGGVIPAATSQVAVTADDFNERLQVRRDLSRQYDHVICRGARKRAVFTVSTVSGNLEIGWRAADETAYKSAVGADPKVNDRFRQTNRFERVYQAFQIPSSWSGTSNDGGSVPGGGAYACPRLTQGSSSIIAAEPISMPGLRLLPAMMIKVGYDYSDATAPTPRDPADTAPEWQRPFAVVDVGSSTWRFSHELSTTGEDDGRNLKGFSIRMLEGVPGVQLYPPDGMPHMLALNHFDPDVDAATEHDPQVDYSSTRVTVCGEWDAFCEGRYPLADGAGEPLQTLYIQIGERARHDWLAAGTIYDIDDGGALKTVSTGGALRDDRKLCDDIARVAFEWYGVARAQISWTTTAETLPVQLGDLITTIGTGAAQETVNAIVSQITHNFEQGSTAIQAGFAELDFAGLV